MTIEQFEQRIAQLERRADQQRRLIDHLGAYIRTLCEIQEGIDHTKYCCPICGKFAPAFMPFVNALNVRCAHCNSLPRHRQFYLVADRILHLFARPIGVVLHFAPEKCLQDSLRLASESYFGLDLSPSPLVNVISDAQALAIPARSINFLYCCHVLEHVTYDQRAMEEVARVLKPSGVATIMVPLHGGYETREDPAISTRELRNKHYGNPNHLRYYGEDIRDRLESAGLLVERYAPSDVVTDEDANRFVLRDDVVFSCRLKG